MHFISIACFLLLLHTRLHYSLSVSMNSDDTETDPNQLSNIEDFVQTVTSCF